MTRSKKPSALGVLAGGGEMGALARDVDWAETPVGAVDTWPQSLRTALSILFESKFPMLVCWGPDFVQFYNDPFRPILGISKHPALGKSTRETFSEAWHIIGPLFAEVMHGTAVGFEDMLVPLDRYGFLEECYFLYSYSPIRDESGGVGGVFVTCTETTARIVAERRLRTLRELASQAAHAQNQQTAWEGAAQVLAASPADVPFALLYALDSTGEATLVGKSALPGAVPVVRAHEKDPQWPLFDAANTGPTIVRNLRRRFGDYSGPVWPEPIDTAIVLPITRPGVTQPYGLLVAGVSPRLPLDDKYRDFLSLIGDQIATAVATARTYEEERRRSEELEDARRSAEAANRAKDEFLAMLGHELRNPLAPILTALQLMTLRGDRGAEKERAIIDRQVRHVVRLVDDLLDVSRIARGKIELRRERIELAAVVAKAVEMTSPVVEQKRHELQIDVAPTGLAVDADQTRLQQVVFNLLHNAAKYTEPHGRIEVKAALRGETIELRVRDTGVGIDAEMLPHVFDLFFQERQAIDRAQGGLGLGLALVRNLVALHGGSVSASSGGRGKGSEFVVTLPASRQQLVRGAASAGSHEARAPVLSGARVLIVDDNEDAAMLLSEALRVSGFDARIAADGPAALQLADSFDPDVGVLDLGLPLMDGYELAARLRQRTRRPALIAVTGYGTRADKQRTRTSGFDVHLVKPIDVNELIAHLRNLDVRRAGR